MELAARAARELERRKIEDKISFYEPLPKLIPAHESTSTQRWVFGGNDAGKSVWLIAEVAFYARGNHPFRNVPPPPIQIRIITFDLVNGIEKNILPKLYEWLPKDLIKSYSKALRIMTLTNGTTIELMSYEQEIVKFQGVGRHLIAFDEEPPEEIYKECLMRLARCDGEIIGALTPTQGMTWIFDGIYNKQEKGFIEVWEIESEDNPYKNLAKHRKFMEQFTEEEREARGKGKFMQLAGVILKKFNCEEYKRDHIISLADLDTRYLAKYGGLDTGFINPTAFALCGFDKSGNFYLFAEHYQSKLSIPENSACIKKAIGRDKPYFIMIDPSSDTRKSANKLDTSGKPMSEMRQYQDEFRKEGIIIRKGSNEDDRHGIRVWEKLIEEGRFFVTENCVNGLMEMARWHWDSYRIRLDRDHKDKAAKAWDHEMHAILYILMSNARYRPKGADIYQDSRKPDQTTGY